jgi:hypothetical protein
MWAYGMVVAGLLLGWGSQARAQTLRFDDYRERKVPEYATIKLGPFYSDVVLNQSIGWRYSLKNLSVSLDLQVVLRTIRTVLFGKEKREEDRA